MVIPSSAYQIARGDVIIEVDHMVDCSEVLPGNNQVSIIFNRFA